MENIAEQWLLMAESRAWRGQKMTMGEHIQRINELLELNGLPVMWEYPKDSDPEAAQFHVRAQMLLYRKSRGTLTGRKREVLPPPAPHEKPLESLMHDLFGEGKVSAAEPKEIR